MPLKLWSAHNTTKSTHWLNFVEFLLNFTNFQWKMEIFRGKSGSRWKRKFSTLKSLTLTLKYLTFFSFLACDGCPVVVLQQIVAVGERSLYARIETFLVEFFQFLFKILVIAIWIWYGIFIITFLSIYDIRKRTGGSATLKQKTHLWYLKTWCFGSLRLLLQ